MVQNVPKSVVTEHLSEASKLSRSCSVPLMHWGLTKERDSTLQIALPTPRYTLGSRPSSEACNTMGNSRITFHHFIFRELFLVIISSWFTLINSDRIVICRICISCLTSSLQATYVIITSENSGGNTFRKDFMGIPSKYSREINLCNPSVSNGSVNVACVRPHRRVAVHVAAILNACAGPMAMGVVSQADVKQPCHPLMPCHLSK